jgi:MFS family permease
MRWRKVYIYPCFLFLSVNLLSIRISTKPRTRYQLFNLQTNFIMPSRAIIATADTARIEAPVTTKAYLMCVFAAFGGFFFGYDSGYIGGVLGIKYFIHTFQHLPYPPAGATADESAYFVLSSSNNSLIVSIFSAGTFFGALFAGDLADWIERRTTIITGRVVFAIGVVIQLASSTIAVLAVGRIIASFGVGFVSAIIILYSNIPISYHCRLYEIHEVSNINTSYSV